MQQLPLPCPGYPIPDATDRFDAAYRAAKTQQVVFTGIERDVFPTKRPSAAG
ncbi:MAG: hypothetical protein HOY76_31130 [Streptomyces sp.]|nr:hypothetical protein [Streptomyces sp.]